MMMQSYRLRTRLLKTKNLIQRVPFSYPNRTDVLAGDDPLVLWPEVEWLDVTCIGVNGRQIDFIYDPQDNV